VPFVFVYEPALVLRGSPFQIIHVLFTAILGVFLIAVALEGYLIHNLGIFFRIVGLAGGMSLVVPGTLSDFFGLSALAIIVVRQKLGPLGEKSSRLAL